VDKIKSRRKDSTPSKPKNKYTDALRAEVRREEKKSSPRNRKAITPIEVLKKITSGVLYDKLRVHPEDNYFDYKKV